MALLMPLESHAELQQHLQRVFGDWAKLVDRTIRRTDELKRKTKEVRPKTYREYVLTADIEFFVRDQKTGETMSLIVPQCAVLTLFGDSFHSWNPEAVAESKLEEARKARNRGARIFRAADAQRPRICFFTYTEAGMVHILSVFNDCEMQLKRVALPASCAS